MPPPMLPTGSCASFGLLWLTDLHFGQKAQTWLWPLWEEEFFRDLEHLYQQSAPWDVILFTGDLAFSGKPDEFDGVVKMLRRLGDFVAAKQQSPPCFLSVPGNHDLQRPDRGLPATSSLRHYWADDTVRDIFWGDPSSEYRKLIDSAFKEYSDLSTKINSVFAPPTTLQPGLLPGDFSATIERGRAKLGIVGLNTSFLQLDGSDHQGQLALDLRQLQSVCDGNAAAWRQQCQVCILLTHHPLDWLESHAQSHFLGAIYPTNGFAGHFHGHMHERADLIVAHAGSAPRRHFQGCSLFGLEHFGEAYDKDRAKFGYAACRLVLDQNMGSFYFWPRVTKRQQSGDLLLVPDTESTLVRGAEYYGPLEFTLNRCCEPPSTNETSHRTDTFLARTQPPPDPAELLRAARAAIDKALGELEARRASLMPGDHLREIGRLSLDFAKLGDRNRAWAILQRPFDREKDALQREERITLGLQLSQFLLEDKKPELAANVLIPLLPEVESLPATDPQKALFWQLQARCGVALSAYQDAVKALKRAIEITSIPDLNSRLQADLAELHLLNGNIEEALIAANKVGPAK